MLFIFYNSYTGRCWVWQRAEIACSEGMVRCFFVGFDRFESFVLLKPSLCIDPRLHITNWSSGFRNVWRSILGMSGTPRPALAIRASWGVGDFFGSMCWILHSIFVQGNSKRGLVRKICFYHTGWLSKANICQGYGAEGSGHTLSGRV